METKIKDLGLKQAIIQVDFSENYPLISQDEIQAAHWKHGQVTLFTAHTRHDCGEKSYDDLSHSKELGEYRNLFRELKYDEEHFFKYTRMTHNQFEEIFHLVKKYLLKRKTENTVIFKKKKL